MNVAEDPEKCSKTSTAIVMGIVLIGGLLPLTLYWVFFASVSAVMPVEAGRLLEAPDSEAMLIDVRSLQDFNEKHIDGAQSWPLEDILATESPNEVPGQFKTKTLLLICDGRMSSSLASKHLVGIGIENVANVRGGIQEWIGSIDGPEGGVYERFSSASGETWPFPYHRSPMYQQLIAVTSGFVIKPAYTVLSLVIIIVLWRSRSADLVALRWSMICFFIGENFCASNYIFFRDKSYLFEYLHSFGMLLSFGFATYAILEGFDSRILMLSNPNQKCAALKLCGKCIKYENAPCGLKRTFFLIIPALGFIALMPLCGRWHDTSYNTMIFDTFYHYARRIIYQWFEMRYCPTAAVVLLCASLMILIFKKTNPLPLAKVLLAAGVGPLGFGMFRSILTAMYSEDLVWFAFWEESTEFLFIAGTCFVLWIFRHRLFEKAAR
jgi:rhodanese-related sulfurtransferase